MPRREFVVVGAYALELVGIAPVQDGVDRILAVEVIDSVRELAPLGEFDCVDS